MNGNILDILNKDHRNKPIPAVSPRDVASQARSQTGKRKQTFGPDDYKAISNADSRGYVKPYESRTLGEIVKEGAQKYSSILKKKNSFISKVVNK